MDKFTPEKKDKVQNLYEKVKKEELKKREKNEVTPEEGRSEFARDYARILYSSSFRRLQGKMQILGIQSTAFFRNRLTHSLEVSQIARSLARILACKCDENNMYCEDEMYLLDAAALAHDIGHPAFGHKGERVLDEIAKKYSLRFEGNAQNYRVLRKLDRHSHHAYGLNLTYRTLLAINKYFVEENVEDEKFMYKEDYQLLKRIREEHELGNGKTIDVQIIELADDIAYAVHDLEDGLSRGMFSLNELLHEINIYENNKIKMEEKQKAVDKFNTIIKDIDDDIINDKELSLQEYSHLFRKELTSKLTDELIRSIDVNQDGELCLESPYSTLCKILPKVIFQCVTKSSSIALYELKGEIIIKTLFNIFADKNTNKDFCLLPQDYRPKNDEKDNKVVAQCIIDYISGMMDTYAISEYERLTGISYDSINVNNIPNITVLD